MGTGGGWILYPYYLAGFNVIGCDYDINYLEYGRKKGMNLIKGSIPELIDRGIKADYLILNQVLEHVDNPVAFLKDRYGHH